MKLSLREKIRVVYALLVLGLLIMLVPLLPGSTVSLDVYIWCVLLSAVCIIGGVFFSATQVRCPHCGKRLGRGYGEYCSHCGVKFDFDAK